MGEVVPIRGESGEGSDSRRLRAVIYLRVSTLEQAATDYGDDGYSLQAQGEACRRTAERLGADVLEEYVDRGKSARNADRPQLQAMLKRIGELKDVDLVIVHKVDRLARNRADDIQIVLALKKAGASLISATENIDETPSGTLLHAIMAAVAEFYSGNLAQEAKKGMKKKAELGGTPGNAPVGYLNQRDRIDGKDIGIVVPDPDRADHVRWAFQRFAEGHETVASLAAVLAERGFTLRRTARYPERQAGTSMVHRMLRNRFYAGYVRFAGVEYEGRHEPLVDEETFQIVQDNLTSRSNAKDKPRSHPHALKSVLHCGHCGRRMGLVDALSRSGLRYPYFYCLGRQADPTSCPQKYVRVERVEDAVLRHVQWLRIRPERQNRLRAAAIDFFKSRTEESAREIRLAQGRIDRLKRRREKVKEAYFADAMGIEELKVEQQKISRELVMAEGTIQRYAAVAERLETGIDAALAVLANPAVLYRSAPDSIRRQLVQELFEKIWILDQKLVGADLTRPYLELLGVDATEAAQAATSHPDAGQITYDRRDPRTYLRVERPVGALAVDDLNLRPNNLAGGSNLKQLVGLTGFEPAASSSRTRRATKLRHSPNVG